MKMTYETRPVTVETQVYVLELTAEERIKLIQHLRQSDAYANNQTDRCYVASHWYDALGVKP